MVVSCGVDGLLVLIIDIGIADGVCPSIVLFFVVCFMVFVLLLSLSDCVYFCYFTFSVDLLQLIHFLCYLRINGGLYQETMKIGF